MPHQYSYRKGNSQERTAQKGQRSQRYSGRSHRFQKEQTRTYLTKLIEQDAPLFTNSHLVLMYGPFQTEMAPEAGQGVASWIKDCIKKHGIPSLVRFDDRRRAQVFRRDQFQPWLEPLMDQAC